MWTFFFYPLLPFHFRFNKELSIVSAGEGVGSGGLGGSRLHQSPPAGANSKEGPAGSSANPAAPMTSTESKSAATSSAGAQQPREQRNRFDKGASGGRKPQSANEAKAHEETVNGTAA